MIFFYSLTKKGEDWQLTKLSDDRYHLRYNLTGKQKKILKELGINEQQYKEFAEEVKEPLEK